MLAFGWASLGARSTAHSRMVVISAAVGRFLQAAGGGHAVEEEIVVEDVVPGGDGGVDEGGYMLGCATAVRARLTGPTQAG
eukprot:SAG11_NODE_7212_length_1177_cov_1.128015_2_plen_81_part_00